METRTPLSQIRDTQLATLRNKIRQQAQRLIQLQHYKALCQERIKQLCPGHPFPITQNHLGQNPKHNQATQLHLAKQKIARLQEHLAQLQKKVPSTPFPHPASNLSSNKMSRLYPALHQQMEKLLKDKSQLQESLRNEMRTNQEQRTYIQVLKQAMEGNHDQIASHVNQNRKQMRLDKLVQENKVLNQQKHRTDTHLEQAAQALSYAQEEIKKLQQEKSSLLDFIEEHTEKQEELKKELQMIKQGAQIQKSSDKEILEALRAEKGHLQNKVNILQTELQKVQKKLSELEILSSQQKQKIIQARQKLQNYEEQLNIFQSRNQSLQANNATLANTLKQTQNELENLRLSYDQSKTQVRHLQQSLDNTNSQIQNIIKNKQRIQGKVGLLEQELLEKERKHRQAQQQLKTCKQEELRQSQTQIGHLMQKVQQTRASYEKAQKTIEEESDSLKLQIELLTKEFQTLSNHKIELEQRLKLSDQLTHHKSLQCNRLSQQNHQLIQQHQQLQSSLSSSQSLYQSLKSQNSVLQDQVQVLRNQTSSILPLQHKLTHIEAQYSQQRRLNTKYLTEIDSLHRELNQNKILLSDPQLKTEGLKIFKQTISNFASNFGAISTVSNTYGVLVSPSMKDLLLRWSRSPPDSSQAIQQWLQTSSQELQALIRHQADLKQQLQSSQSSLRKAQSRLEAFSFDQSALQERERALRFRVQKAESEVKSHFQQKANFISRQHQFQQEIKDLKSQLQTLQQSNSRYKNQLQILTSETVQWRHSVQTDSFTIKTVEEKSRILQREKNQLQALLFQISHALPPQSESIFSQILRTRSDIEASQRERLNIENLLKKTESQQRLSYSPSPDLSSLQSQLTNCQVHLQLQKRKLTSLQDSLKSQSFSTKSGFDQNRPRSSFYSKFDSFHLR